MLDDAGDAERAERAPQLRIVMGKNDSNRRFAAQFSHDFELGAHRFDLAFATRVDANQHKSRGAGDDVLDAAITFHNGLADVGRDQVRKTIAQQPVRFDQHQPPASPRA